jgi:plastocyanin
MTRTPLLALLLVPALVAGCSGSDSGSSDTSVTTSGAASAQTATVGMNDKLKFDPNVVQAKVGTVTLSVDNLGKVPHNLVFDDESLGKTGTIAGKAKEPLKVTFAKAGTFTFVCTFHPGMTGKVVVS